MNFHLKLHITFHNLNLSPIYKDYLSTILIWVRNQMEQKSKDLSYFNL